jgi:hypothetical protein
LPGHGEVVPEGASEKLRSLISEDKIWPLSGDFGLAADN